MNSTVAYFSAGYPRVTDSFITREMAGVAASGLAVERFAVRPPGEDQLRSELQRNERDHTTYLLERPAREYLSALASAARRSPRRCVAVMRLAFRTKRAGVDGALRQGAYVVEAALLSKLLIERGVDHLHNHFEDSSCTVAMLASELTGIPFSFTVHGPAIFFEPMQWRLDVKVDRAKFVVAISSFARSQTCIYADPTTWERIHIVHCGVEDLGPSPISTRPDGRLELLYVGRLEPVKGISVLFDAVAQLVDRGTNVRLTVVGDGGLRDLLERRSAELGLGDAIRFTGYRSQEQIREHLADCDALVLPSFAEGVPVSLMEAMSQERAVVATSVGGVTELVHNGDNGLVVKAGDSDELADALASLADNAERRAAMGVAGRALVRSDFDAETEARRLVTLITNAEQHRGVVRPDPV